MTLYLKKIYFSGGSFYELEELFSRIKGVSDVKTGYVNSEIEQPSHEDVLAGKTGAAMGVEVSYDPKKIDLSSLMDILFTVLNPYVKDKQGEAEGPMYRMGVYYVSLEDEPMVQYHMNFIHNRRKKMAATESELTLNDPNSDPVGARKCYAEAMRLKTFFPAENEHQNYLKSHPHTKTYIDFKQLEELAIIS